MPDYVNHGSVNLLIGMYHANKLQFSLTESSTATSCIHVLPEKSPPGGFNSLTVFVHDDGQLATELHSLVDQGYCFTVGSVRVTCSIWQLRLRDAKQTLLEKLLIQTPTPFDVQKVVSDSGIALNYQADKALAMRNVRDLGDDICQKLTYLGLESDERKLHAKYRSLNRYYNATKHAKTLSNESAIADLSGQLGKEIAIDYFETVVRIFSWYYTQHADGIPNWDELKPVDYASYACNYVFLVDKVWP
jgi:hypothetical protein